LADGFYFDNTFLRTVFRDGGEVAHCEDGGCAQSGKVDILELREFLRRAQTLAFNVSGRWANVVHMTNTPIVSIEAWAAATLDGEMRYGSEPFAERFRRDWIRAEATGEQFGSLPIMLAGVVGMAPGTARDKIELSMVAGSAVHEMRIFGGAEVLADRVWEPLYRFGYGQPDATVHRYWDRPPRFDLDRDDAEGLVVVRGNEALALVVSFGGAGETSLQLAGEDLGLVGPGHCRDYVTGRRLAEVHGFGCRFELPKHGFRFVAWKAKR